MNILEFLKNNFFHVAPILIAGGIAAVIIFERFQTLFKVYSLQNTEGFLNQIKALVSKGRTNDALALCMQYSGKPTAEVVKAALERAHQPEELVINTIEYTRNQFAEKIQKRTAYLATIANVATLLGLLGTIAGLIESFTAVGHADPQQKAAILANGISTAMNATMLGLGVAVPCMVLFSFLINKANHLISEVEAGGMTVHDSLQVYSMGVEENTKDDRRAS
jgi:biopolymer transport protein ExbB